MHTDNAVYVSNALFVETPENRHNLESLQRFDPAITIQSLSSDDFLAPGYVLDSAVEHVILCARIAPLKAMLEVAIQYDVGLGIIPTKEQKQLSNFLGLTTTQPMEWLELALQQNQQAADLIRCNGYPVLLNAKLGNVSLSQSAEGHGGWRVIRRFFSDLSSIRLLGFKFILPGRKVIDTAASGCVVVMHHSGSLAARLVGLDSNARDGMISMLVAAPVSVLGYLAFLARFLQGQVSINKLPDTLGYIKVRAFRIETSEPLEVEIDGQVVTETPLDCAVEPLALRVNRKVSSDSVPQVDSLERVDLKNLPMGAEKSKAMKKKLPFFPYATEERFKDLFTVLRQDAQSHNTYLVLMVLSTLLATVGLFLNSSSVIIGAMLLAPLMAPIVSLAMGILRSDKTLYFQSSKTIVLGIFIALGASALLTQILPSQLVTGEMSARLNPSLLDLAVAILAGVAAAYTKSNRDMLSSLAGVAIAVALVPPLAVAGVGLGRVDVAFFGHAFLLFSTNLVGIIVAAAITFRALGYSPAIKAKKSFLYVVLTLALISVPLYLSYGNIVEKVRVEQAWKKERFLVNGKYLIVKKTDRYTQRDREVMEMEIYARDNLSREDLDAFKAKIRGNFEHKLIIRANVTYIL